MFSNLSKNQQVFIIDKREDGILRIGVVEEIKNANPYQLNTIGITPTLPFDLVVKYEDGSTETFPQIMPAQSVQTYNNGDIIVCDSRDMAQNEVEKINAYSRKHLELVPHFEKLLSSSEQMLRQLNPSYAKQQQTEEDIKHLKDDVRNVTDTLSEMKGMMEKVIAGISSTSKKST